MDMTTKEILKKKILDAQEMVRDYEVYSKRLMIWNWQTYLKIMLKNVEFKPQI